MKILVDVSAGRAISDLLVAMGHDTEYVRDRDARMPDDEILAWAVSEQRLVVTMDKDFGELVFRSGLAHSGVLLLRLETARLPEKTRVVTDIFSNHAADLAGHFAVYQNSRLRIR